jgi:hypothetical protein
MMSVTGGTKRRVLKIDRARNMFVRLSPVVGAGGENTMVLSCEHPLDGSIKLEPLIGEPCKLRVIAGVGTASPDSKEYTFASHDSRARFSGQINLIQSGIDPSKVRYA